MLIISVSIKNRDNVIHKLLYSMSLWFKVLLFDTYLFPCSYIHYNALPCPGLHKIFFVLYPKKFKVKLSYRASKFNTSKCAKSKYITWHNFMAAADSAVVLLEFDVQLDKATNKRFNSAYLQIKYFICRKIHSNILG